MVTNSATLTIQALTISWNPTTNHFPLMKFWLSSVESVTKSLNEFHTEISSMQSHPILPPLFPALEFSVLLLPWKILVLQWDPSTPPKKVELEAIVTPMMRNIWDTSNTQHPNLNVETTMKIWAKTLIWAAANTTSLAQSERMTPSIILLQRPEAPSTPPDMETPQLFPPPDPPWEATRKNTWLEL